MTPRLRDATQVAIIGNGAMDKCGSAFDARGDLVLIRNAGLPMKPGKDALGADAFRHQMPSHAGLTGVFCFLEKSSRKQTALSRSISRLHRDRREVDEPAFRLHKVLDLRAHGARADVVGDPEEGGSPPSRLQFPGASPSSSRMCGRVRKRRRQY